MFCILVGPRLAQHHKMSKMLALQLARSHPFEVVVLAPQQLVDFGIPPDLSAELTPCLARGVLDQGGRPRTLHLTHVGGCLKNPTKASVVYTTKGEFSRMVLQRGSKS